MVAMVQPRVGLLLFYDRTSMVSTFVDADNERQIAEKVAFLTKQEAAWKDKPYKVFVIRDKNFPDKVRDWFMAQGDTEEEATATACKLILNTRMQLSVVKFLDSILECVT